MKEMFRLVGVLTLICLCCSALLAAVYEKTRDPIAAAAAARRQAAARDVLPADAPTPRLIGFGGVTNYAAFDAGGSLIATAVEGRSTKGYGGDVVLMVGISAEGQVLDFQVIDAKETPGLGTRIGSPAFKKGIRGRAMDANWTVKKDGGEVDAVTAATISSRAALDAIRQAIAWHREWLATTVPAAAIPRAPESAPTVPPVNP